MDTIEFTLQEATDFFAEFYRGDYHIPSTVSPCGRGWEVRHYGTLATFDFDELTRLVLMAHEKCIRVEITPCNFRLIKIRIHKRVRDGNSMRRHPTLEQVLRCNALVKNF